MEEKNVELHQNNPIHSNFFSLGAVPEMTSAFDARTPPPPKWSHTLDFKPRPPTLERQLFPLPPPYPPLTDVIFGWPLIFRVYISTRASRLNSKSARGPQR